MRKFREMVWEGTLWKRASIAILLSKEVCSYFEVVLQIVWGQKSFSFDPGVLQYCLQVMMWWQG